MRIVELEDPRRRDIRQILAEVYERHTDISEAAASLGLTEAALRKWIHVLGGRIAVERRVVFPEFDGAREQVETLPLEAVA